MSKSKRDWLLGLVFFAGLALLLWATQELNGLTLTPKQLVQVKFKNARSLRTGEPVFVLGTQSGKVNSVEIGGTDPNYPVEVVLELASEVTLHKDAAIMIEDASFLGGKKVNIEPGSGVRWEQSKDADLVFVGTAPLGPLAALGDVISGENNKENLQQILDGVRKFVDDLNAADGSLRKFIEKSELYDNAERFVASLRKSAEELERKEGLLGRLIYDEELGKTAAKIVADAEQVTDQLTKTDGTLGRLINDKVLADKLEKIVGDVDTVTTRLSQSKTPLGRLINDEELGTTIAKIIDDFAKVTTTLNDKDSGLLGALLNDREMLADARKIFDDLAEITDDINSGKGALGRLINDEDMGRRLDSMIRQVTRAIEDAREAAPIGTFFQVFSGTF